jgi:hypothetical protein
MALKEYIQDVILKKCFSDQDIRKNGCYNIKLYHQLKNINSVNKLLGPEKCCMLLVPTINEYDGHWCYLFRNDRDQIEFFDSYGKHPDYWLAKSKVKTYPYLTDILLKSGEPIVYNEFPFQSKGNDISTCGRWAILRHKFRNLNKDRFASCFGNKITLKPDELCSLLI